MIRLGRTAAYAFEGPYTLGGWTPLERPGVYVITYKQNPEVDSHAVIYVGESENLAAEGLPTRHARSHCWTARAGSPWKLFIAYYLLSGSPASIRASIAAELMAMYDPVCNQVDTGEPA